MSSLPRTAQLYIWTLAVLAGSFIFVAIRDFPFTRSYVGILLLFSILSALAGIFPVVLPRKLVEITANVAVDVAAALLFPFSLAILVPTIGALAGELYNRRVWYKGLFNVSEVTVTYAVVYGVSRLVFDNQGLLIDSLHDTIGVLLTGSVYYLLNTFLVVLIVSLAGQMPLMYVYYTNLRSITWHQVSMVCAGFLMAYLWTVNPWSIVLVVLPVAILRQAVSLTALLETQTREAIEVLVDTVDARDPSTFQHSERVAAYARAIAEEMKLSRAEIEKITLSASLHDLGKVGIGDVWLYKDGPLTDEERAQFQRHSELGANIVARLPVLGVEHEMVLYHHERWDGKGYPAGIKGEDIPLGARIIGTADAFDAMTSDRPYRKALSFEEAHRRLRQGAGTQFDPRIVEIAHHVLPHDTHDTIETVVEHEVESVPAGISVTAS